MGSQPDLSRIPEGSPGLPVPSLLPRSRALYLAGPTRRATFGPKILRRKRQSRGRVASHALLSPSRMVGPPPLARSRCPFIPAEPRSARPPLAAWPLVALDNKQGGANCLGLCIPLAVTIRIATQTLRYTSIFLVYSFLSP